MRQWSDSLPNRFSPSEKDTESPGVCWTLWRKGKSLPLPEIQPRFVGRSTCSLVAMPTWQSRILLDANGRRNSSVSIVTGLWPDKRRYAVRFLAEAKIFPQGLSDREADHPPPFSNEVRTAWRYTSTPTRVFLGCCLSKDKRNWLFRTKIMQKEIEARWLEQQETNCKTKKMANMLISGDGGGL
jgi:hypothetical protein